MNPFAPPQNEIDWAENLARRFGTEIPGNIHPMLWPMTMLEKIHERLESDDESLLRLVEGVKKLTRIAEIMLDRVERLERKLRDG